MLRVFFSEPFILLSLSLLMLSGPACAKSEATKEGKTDAPKETSKEAASAPELELGAAAPTFELPGTDGELHSLPTVDEAKAVVVVFTCLACPYAQAYEDRIMTIARDYAERGVRVVAINSNDPKVVPADSFDKMKARAAEKKYPFPFVFDETQEVAKAYGARVTPHVFLFGPDRKLAYRGRVDNEANPEKVTQPDLRNALDAVLAGKEVAVTSTKAFGCKIKWKAT